MGKVIKFYKDSEEWFLQHCKKQYQKMREKYTDEQIIEMTKGKSKYLNLNHGITNNEPTK